jgi:hypothetical protein
VQASLTPPGARHTAPTTRARCAARRYRGTVSPHRACSAAARAARWCLSPTAARPCSPAGEAAALDRLGLPAALALPGRSAVPADKPGYRGRTGITSSSSWTGTPAPGPRPGRNLLREACAGGRAAAHRRWQALAARRDHCSRSCCALPAPAAGQPMPGVPLRGRRPGRARTPRHARHSSARGPRRTAPGRPLPTAIRLPPARGRTRSMRRDSRPRCSPSSRASWRRSSSGVCWIGH